MPFNPDKTDELKQLLNSLCGVTGYSRFPEEEKVRLREQVLQLITDGADPHVGSEHLAIRGSTIIHMAVLANDAVLLKKLQEMSISFVCYDNQMRTPWQYLLQQTPEVIELLEKDKELVIAAQAFSFEQEFNFDSPYQTGEESKVKPLNDPMGLLDASFIIGETHSRAAAKIFMMQNARKLKQSGFHTVFLEHIPYRMQGLLDEFLRTKQMPSPLKAYLTALDRGFTKQGNESYSFVALVTKMIEADIRVVGLEQADRYEQDRPTMVGDSHPQARIHNFNSFACAVIEREMSKKPQEKYFALMGHAHIGEFLQEIPGCVKRLSSAQKPVRSVYIFETLSPDSNPQFYLDHSTSMDQFQFHADLYVDVSPDPHIDLTLPSITREISPKLAPNTFIFFKESSGEDAINSSHEETLKKS